eukprot:4775555-Karenia_brevis.AAC.1
MSIYLAGMEMGNLLDFGLGNGIVSAKPLHSRPLGYSKLTTATAECLALLPLSSPAWEFSALTYQSSVATGRLKISSARGREFFQ